MALAVTNWGDGVSWTGGVDSDSFTFTLLGGKYGLVVYSSGTASATLSLLAPDGSHYIACAAAVTTYATFDLPPGTYQIAEGASATTQNGALVRIPYRAP